MNLDLYICSIYIYLYTLHIGDVFTALAGVLCEMRQEDSPPRPSPPIRKATMGVPAHARAAGRAGGVFGGAPLPVVFSVSGLSSFRESNLEVGHVS